MPRIKKSTLEQLEQTHLRYCDYNQRERSDCALMARLGHPKAKAYLRLRRFFDSLRYACNASARRFSYVDQQEHAEYWAPELWVSWYPSGELRRFGHIYPAHVNWEQYLEAAAAANWKGAEPQLRAGTWYIHTRSAELKDAVFALRDVYKLDVDDRGEEGEHILSIRLDGQSAACSKIAALVRKHHKGFVLPTRTDAQDRADTAPKPLAEKKFMLGNVDQVTVTDRHVLVPLVPFGTAGDVLVQKTVERLVQLLSEGFPFAQAKEWLQKFLKPKSFKQLEAQFA